jgi:hypothetical protein
MSIPEVDNDFTVPDPNSPSTYAALAQAFMTWWKNTFGPSINATISAINTLIGTLSSLAAGGGVSIPYTVSNQTSDADPGDHYLRLDNFAAQTSATTLRLALVSADDTTRTSELDDLFTSTSATKARGRLQKVGDTSKWLSFDITAIASAGSRRNLTITNVRGSSAAPFTLNDSVVFTSSAKGDKGDTTSLSYEERTTNTALSNSDNGKHIKITGSGGITQTFNAVSGFGAGWTVFYENGSTGNVTLDPNSSEQIDGLASYVMYPGEVRKIQRTVDGAGFTSTVLHSFSATFTASGTFTTPPGYKLFAGLLWGGGGSGGKGTNGGGGGGGACVEFRLPAASFGSSQSVTIGAQVAGQTSANTAGTGGNNSSIGSLVTAYAGGAGAGGSSNAGGGGGGGAFAAGSSSSGTSGGTGGSPAGGANGTPGSDSNFGGGGGGNNGNGGGNSVYGGGGGAGSGASAGGKSIFGGGGGGGQNAGAAGTSSYGGNGGAGVSAASGGDGTAPGGGGGATGTGTTSGAGARGELRIWGIA